MSLEAGERETVINATDGDDLIKIWTAQRRFITKLRRNPNFTEVDSGHYGSTEWAQFTIPADRWNPASGAKRAHGAMSAEQRLAAAERLARGRETRSHQPSPAGGVS